MSIFEVGQAAAGTVTVIIPAYNAEQFIRRALDSLLKQTYTIHQIILIDKDSQDATRQIVAEEYANRVTLIEQQPGGHARARNAGLRIATSEFIAFLDADDSWEPEKIATQLGVLASHSEAIGNYTGLRVLGDAGEHLGDLPPAEHTTLRRVLRWCNPGIPPSSVLLRRSALEKLDFGFDERLHGCEDWNFWHRLIAHGPFSICAEPLTVYQSSSGGPSDDADHMYNDFLKMLDDVLLADVHGLRRAIWRRRILSYQSFKACLTARAAGDTAREREYMMKSVAEWPSPFWAPERLRYFAVTAMRT